MGCAQSKTATARRGDVRLVDDDDATTTTTEVRVKLVLLGASGAGKTALSTRFVRGTFDGENASATVGAAFASTTRALDDARARIKFEIWDTAGQERYASLAPLYYRGATAAMIAFDARDGASFERARYWAEELRKHGDARCRVLLVGNKLDAVRDDERATAREACEMGFTPKQMEEAGYAPEEIERSQGKPFAVRLGANELTFGPSPKTAAAMAEAASLSLIHI